MLYFLSGHAVQAFTEKLRKGCMKMAIKTRKIGIMGAGNVGPHVALLLAAQGAADEMFL